MTAYNHVNLINRACTKLIDYMSDDCFTAEGQEQFLDAHSLRLPRSKNYRTNH
jgi:hypothetical protein